MSVPGTEIIPQNGSDNFAVFTSGTRDVSSSHSLSSDIVSSSLSPPKSSLTSSGTTYLFVFSKENLALINSPPFNSPLSSFSRSSSENETTPCRSRPVSDSFLSQTFVPVNIIPKTDSEPEMYTVPSLPAGLKGRVYLRLSTAKSLHTDSNSPVTVAGPLELEFRAGGKTFTAAQCGEAEYVYSL